MEKKEGLCSFPELLSKVSAIEGLLRIRFTTSHPKDLNDELINEFKTNEKLCDHIHLPVQSGSNRILKRMNRGYTKELYLDKVAKLRDTCNEIAITTDFIVGFPGETDADFNETLDLIRTVAFDGLFAFMYSDRPRAPAAKLNNKVSESHKSNRLQILLELQEDITKIKNQTLIGTIQPIIVEGFSKRPSSSSVAHPNSAMPWTGRTSTNKIVHFHQNENSENRGFIVPGRLVHVKIEEAYSHSLWGKPVEHQVTTEGLKGEKSYAA